MVVFLIDADNLSKAEWIDEACLELETRFDSLTVKRAYGSAENLKGLANVLRTQSIRPFANLPLSKNTTDVALAVDAMDLANHVPCPTVLAIGSGDADFLPLVVRLRERGVRLICVSERSKMSNEVEAAYNEIVLVGTAPPPIELRATEAVPAKKIAATKTVAAKKAKASKVVAAKKKPAKAAAKSVSIGQILAAYPNLKSGDPCELGIVSKALHDKKLLSKTAKTTALFKQYSKHFELSPAKQPHKVRYLC